MTKSGQGGRKRQSESQSEAWGAQLWVFGVIFGGAYLFFGLLYHLMQPSVVANPGLAAFVPPPATRLVPLPRQSDAPALAELPVDATAPLKAFAEAAPEARPIANPPAHKRPRLSSTEPRRPDYAQQWNSGFPDWGSGNWSGGNRAAGGDLGGPGNRVWRGGPRSTF